MTRSLPPSMGIWAPVVAEKTGPATVLIMAATPGEVISVLRRFLVLYSCTVMP